MNDAKLAHLQSWVGKTQTDEDWIAARQARLMSATVDYFAPERLRDSGALPPLWHWIYFLDALPASELGRDGHPERGGFLPPAPLPNRMWAGGRVAFLAPVKIGERLRKRSRILKVEGKTGRSGELLFVTVLHELETPEGEPLVREEHDIVFKGASIKATRASTAIAPAPAAPPAGESRTLTPTSTQLFRYSALTFNGHRIHYDQDYCREVEGYDNLVIHGPLIATLLAGYAEEVALREKKRLAQFNYRALAPALLGETLTLTARVEGLRLDLASRLRDGSVNMRAEALLAH